LAGLAGLLITGSAVPRADAVLLSLGLQQAGVNGGAITTVATDSNSPGNLSFTGTYGSFSLGNTGAVGSPAEVQPNLSTSVLVSSNSTGRILFVYMTEQGLTSPQGAHQFVSRFEISLISGAISPISLRTLVSSSNELYSGSVLAPLTTFSNVGAASSTNTTPRPERPLPESEPRAVRSRHSSSRNVLAASGDFGHGGSLAEGLWTRIVAAGRGITLLAWQPAGARRRSPSSRSDAPRGIRPLLGHGGRFRGNVSAGGRRPGSLVQGHAGSGERLRE
jgi:hypothetical protein